VRVAEICLDELRSLVPPLHSQKGTDDPIVYLKFFSESGLIWYATEGSAVDDDFVFFGFVIGLEDEWGEFSLSELATCARSGLAIEREAHFKPERFSRIISTQR
jgi:Protein of unknown function (DUF2958)